MHIQVNQNFAKHNDFLSQLMNEIEKYADTADINTLQKLKSSFELKTADFFRDGRKLNIGVMGRVKAGKSSFLNTLLFDGQAVLPKDSTPKTAVLTKIEYSETNKLEIEYDSEEEPLLAKGKETISFESYDALKGKLNDYVGENGTFTAAVKSVTLFIDRKELKGISIVDTPGLNAPVVSRTQCTREFIELCDIVFFLSPAESFLDKNDWSLLSTQLSQKGTKKLVLIASKYDSAIRDVLRKKTVGDDIFDEPVRNSNETNNIPDAIAMTAQKLNSRAQEEVSLFVEDLKRRGAGEELIKVISSCREPLLVSSLCCSMANRSPDDYDEEELNVYRAISNYTDYIAVDIAYIGNFDKVRNVYNCAIKEKEELLAEKEKSFIPMSLAEVRKFLITTKAREEKRLIILKNSDQQQLFERKKESEQQIEDVKSGISAILDEASTALERSKTQMMDDLRKLSSEYTYLSDKTGTCTKTGSNKVSISKWYNPFSWGKSRIEYYTYEESYSYMEVSDATDNIHKYVNGAVEKLEGFFPETVNLAAMKDRLLSVIVNNFDTSNQNYDADFFRLLAEKSINEIEFPTIKLDFTDKEDEITSKFTGEITASGQMADLSQMLSETLQKIFDEAAVVVEKEIEVLKKRLDLISVHLTDALLSNIQKELGLIFTQFKDRELQMDKITAYIKLLNDVIEKI